MKVYILTYCKSIEQLYGNTLIFKSLRVGFPNAEVTVIDNQSIPEAIFIISKLARENGCNYMQLNNTLPYYNYYTTIIKRESGKIMFLDPDLMFWECCENWDFGDCLIGGRRIPKFYDEFSGCITYERIHTSFLWIKNTEALLKEIEQMQKKYLHFEPLRPYMFRNPDNGEWYRFDIISSLYHALPKHKIYHFRQKELDSYDHIFCGTHLNLIIDSIDEKDRQTLRQIHETARHDFRKLKGLWKIQDDYFKRRQVD